MSVATLHPEHLANLNAWQRLRDVVGGEDMMKRAGERYVPKLDSQDDLEYQAYVGRGFFYNATLRTHSGYLGLIFRKPPALKLPPGKPFAAFEDDVDLLGTTMVDYSRRAVGEVLAVGRGGTLIDWMMPPENRAYLAFYTAENICNWRQVRIAGRMELSLLVLREWVEEADGQDEFDTKMVEQMRVLKLVPLGQTWQCHVELWQQIATADKKLVWTLVSKALPMRRGIPLSRIPFVFHGPSNSQPCVERSPMEDLVFANLDHYKVNVDFKHGLHFTALPTAWVSGFDKTTTLKIGSTTAWVTETLGATAGYLEFRGEGLQTFERALDRIERLMTVLGSRLLESQKRVSESAEALAIRQAGESSILANVASALSGSLESVLRWVHWWNSTEELPSDVSTDVVTILLNNDFDTAHLGASEIQSLVSAWQAGALSRESLHYQFTRGELLPPNRTLDEEIAAVKLHPAPAPAPVQTAPPEPVLV